MLAEPAEAPDWPIVICLASITSPLATVPEAKLRVVPFTTYAVSGC